MTPRGRAKQTRRGVARPPKRARSARDRRMAAAPTPDRMELLFESLRTGAANVAGVTFQIAATAWALTAGRSDSIPGLDVMSVVPEGLEDIDCELGSGGSLLIQTKERGVGARAIALAEIAEIIAHAAEALGADRRLAIVTNGKFGSSIPATGFTTCLQEGLLALPDGDQTYHELVQTLQRHLDEKGVTDCKPEALLGRTHLVCTQRDLSHETLAALEEGLALHPAVASLVRAELLCDLGEMAARQRDATMSTRLRRTSTDVDLLATRIRQAVDVSTLEEAVLAGVCEPADFVSAPAQDRAGFLAGVDVTPAHIAAGFDVVRPEETNAVMEGLIDRGDVLIAGPSGSGKSALLWRAARLVDVGARIVRVLRVADARDVELLVRHVRRNQPSASMRLLVVADDLGRDRMAAWPDARDRLREMAGVLVVGAGRREDLTPQISGSAVVVDPILTESAAQLIYDAFEHEGIPTAMARDEAVARADGLLMEFIALATTGQRLRDVLSVQVGNLQGAVQRVRREALRIVCAAHLLGSAVPADAMARALNVDDATVSEAMSRLVGEHLLVAEGRWWHGLHDLRTEVLFELLHRAPPPTVSMTYARALAVIPDAAQGPAARRAAVRIGRMVTADTPDLSPSDRLDAIEEALKPIGAALRDALAHTAAKAHGDDSAAHAASLIEAADRVDTLAFAHAVLPFLERHRPPTLPLGTFAGLTYSAAVDGLNLGELTPEIDRLGRQLPERRSTCARAVGTTLTPELLADLGQCATVRTAIRLFEAAEGIATLSQSHARDVYRVHIPGLPQPPGSDGTRLDGDLRAKLTATLTVLAQLRGSDIELTFGSAEARAADAVACDDHGCAVELSLVAPEPPAPQVKNLARGYTYSDKQMLVANVTAFARPNSGDVPTAYTSLPGSDPSSLNEQAVMLARRLFDACPEVDRVDVAIWQANCRPTSPTREDIKSLRAGVVRRAPDIARNVAFQAAVAEILGSESWTRRLREQATIAQSVAQLLQELPDRLRRYDNAARRRDWISRVEQAARAVARMPGPPPERRPVLGAARASALRKLAAEFDEELRAPDRARQALEALTGAMTQVSDHLDDRPTVRLAGSRLADVPAKLRAARALGAPAISGVGDTLPEQIDTLAAVAGRLLTALETPAVESLLRGPRCDEQRIHEVISQAAREASQQDAQTVVIFLSEGGVVSSAAVITDEDPAPAWRTVPGSGDCGCQPLGGREPGTAAMGRGVSGSTRAHGAARRCRCGPPGGSAPGTLPFLGPPATSSRFSKKTHARSLLSSAFRFGRATSDS